MSQRVGESCLSPLLLRAFGSVHATRIREAEAVTLTGFEPDIASIEITLHLRGHGHPFKVNEATRCIRLDEERIRVREIVVNDVTLRKHTHVPHGVDIVIRRSWTKSGLKQTIRNELKVRWDNQLLATNRDFEAALIDKGSNVNQGILKAGFVQVSIGAGLVTKRAVVDERMVSSTKLLTVAASKRAIESIVEDRAFV